MGMIAGSERLSGDKDGQGVGRTDGRREQAGEREAQEKRRVRGVRRVREGERG